MVRTENRMNVLCFDVGGTSIKYALMDKEAKILEKGNFDATTDSMESFLSSIKEVYESYKGRFEGVSFSMPGVIDPATAVSFIPAVLMIALFITST